MKENWGLYNSNFEHDACGIGAVVNIKGKKSNKVINDALDILENLSIEVVLGLMKILVMELVY